MHIFPVINPDLLACRSAAYMLSRYSVNTELRHQEGTFNRKAMMHMHKNAAYTQILQNPSPDILKVLCFWKAKCCRSGSCCY